MPEVAPAPVTRRERSKLDRRQTIVDAARTSFLMNGYAGTSMSGLLKTLGGSKATLWSYFRSKEELFAAVVEDVSSSFRSEVDHVLSVDPNATPETVLANFCETFLQKILSPEALATWRLVVAESGRFPEVGSIFFERTAWRTQSALIAFVTSRIEAGQLRDEDAAKMAEMLIGLCMGRQTRLLWGGAPPSPEELHEDARRFARWFQRAFGAEQRDDDQTDSLTIAKLHS